MTNKVVLVTGAASGIGRATAFEFAELGYVVIVSDINPRVELTCQEITEKGFKAFYVYCDITKFNDQIKLIKEIDNRFSRLDYAANVAGIMQTPCGILDTDEEKLNCLIDVNIKGTWLSMQHQIAYMIKQGYGSIVNVSSIAAIKTVKNLAAYGCTKAAILSFTKAAAKEFASYGIKINAISPGLTMTEVAEKIARESPDYFKEEILGNIPTKKAASPKEIAQSIVWLCTNSTSAIIGHNLIADGGVSA